VVEAARKSERTLANEQRQAQITKPLVEDKILSRYHLLAAKVCPDVLPKILTAPGGL
jgi:hypothetical protein